MRLSGAVLLGIAPGCESPMADAGPQVVSVELLPAGPLVQPVRIILESPAPVSVEYATTDGPSFVTRSPAALRHDLLLARLNSGRVYDAHIAGARDTFSFSTAPLPEDLRRVRFQAEGTPGVPLFLVHLYSPHGFRGYAIIDGAGEVVWYRRTEDFPFGVARRANGNFVVMDRGRGLQEITPAGILVREVPQDAGGRELHHDVIATADNTVLFIAHEPRDHAGTVVRGEAIWEWTPESGALVRRWNSWDALSIDADRGPRFGVEWMHANSLAIGPRGNVLMSVHYFDQVLSITPDWSGLEWRLGGVNATVSPDPADAFSGQHTAAEVAPGRVLLFDNGIARGGPSRAVEFELVGDRAVRRWEWVPPAGHYASAVSSARRLANGNTLVAFGMTEGLNGSRGGTAAFEVTPRGASVWRLRVEGVRTMFRVEPLETVAGEAAADAGER